MKTIFLGITLILYGGVWTLKASADFGLIWATLGLIIAFVGYFVKEAT